MRFRLVALVALVVALADTGSAQSILLGMRTGRLSARHAIVESCNGTIIDAVASASVSCFGGQKPLTRRPPAVTASFLATVELVSSWVALEGELSLVEKGMLQPDFAELRAGYLEMPVLLRLAYPVSDVGVHVFVHGGAAPSRELSCEAHQHVRNPRNHLVAVPSRCEQFRDDLTDLGLVVGTGILLRLPNVQATLSWRHTKGTNNIASDGGSRKNDTRAILLSFQTRAR